MTSGAERLDDHGGRRVHVPGVGLVEILPTLGPNGLPEVLSVEPLSPAQQERLAEWLEREWPNRK
jgi:hypothetical protein